MGIKGGDDALPMLMKSSGLYTYKGSVSVRSYIVDINDVLSSALSSMKMLLMLMPIGWVLL